MRNCGVGAYTITGEAARCSKTPSVWRLGAAFIACLVFQASATHAETMFGALAKAYTFSADIGQQRAAGRAADEGVPKAAAALRPTVSAVATTGIFNNRLQNPGSALTPNLTIPPYVIKNQTYPRTLGLTVTQTLYNGNRAINSVRQAESTALASREQTRLTEIMVLEAAATAYMNVLQTSALLSLNQNNRAVLKEQLHQNEERFRFGEITRTDVAQSQAALAQGEAGVSTAEGNLQAALAVYRQLIGEPPKNLSPAQPIDRMIPESVDEAVAASQREHPVIQAALHAADAAELNVKVQEGALYPTVQVQGSLAQAWDASSTPKEQVWNYGATGTISMPIYDGGGSYSSIRQAKEQYSQARLQADLQRETVRSAVVAAWAALRSTRANIRSFDAQIRANEIALDGVRQEAKVGQRTTLDVLNAQQTLLNSRTNLVGAQRDQVVQSYNLLAAMGRLSARELGLKTAIVDPADHLDQVKSKIWGVRTPDGK